MLSVCSTRNRLGWPFDEFAALAHWPGTVDRALDRVGDDAAVSGLPVDVRDDGDDLVVEAEVPGRVKDDVAITVEDGVLSVAVAYPDVDEDEQKNYHLRERRYGKFERSFRLPSTADGENVTADLRNGLLTVRIPTRAEAKPRQIEVK